MILVITGSEASSFNFNRLIKKMDEISRHLNEEVIIQIGRFGHVPQNAKYFRFLPEEDFIQIYKSSRIVVTHAGVGSIITALKLKKRLIVVPRMKAFGEHIDDHQIEFANIINQIGLAPVIYDIDKLKHMLEIDYPIEPNIELISDSINLRLHLRRYLESITCVIG